MLCILTKSSCPLGSSVTEDSSSSLSLHTCMDFHVWLPLRQQGQEVVHAGSVQNVQKEFGCGASTVESGKQEGDAYSG